MSPIKRSPTKQAKARQRRRLQAHERLERDRRQAQQAAEALHQALEALGLPENLVVELEGRLRSQHKLLGKMVGVMFPTLFGCRTPSELCRVWGWDKQWPSRILGALPKRSWLKRRQPLGLEVLEPLWRHVAHKSQATQSRWQWTWVWDDAVFHKYGAQLGLVGRWWSGQQKRVLSGIDGLLLLVVIGDGRLVVPVDFAIRRPDPVGPGAPCRDKLRWAWVMLDERLAALRRRGLELAAPIVVADSWFSDSKRMQHVGDTHQGTLPVESKKSYIFSLADGQKVKGNALIQGKGWRWRRRTWIALVFRTLKHLLGTEACQVHSEDAYYGHLVLRLMGSFVLFYTSRVICKGCLSMEEIIFSLKHYWRLVDLEALGLQTLS